MPRLIFTALVLATALALLVLAVERLARLAATLRSAPRLAALGATPMQRLSFVLLVSLIFYAAIWGAG